MGQPHDHALIAALKKVTDDNQFQPSGQNSDTSTSNAFQPASTVSTDQKSIDDFEFMDSCKSLTTQNLIESWPAVQQMVDEGKFRAALQTLSRFYFSQDVAGPQRQRLMGWLNALTAKVIYSSEHHFRNEPYIVRQGDTLNSLANVWGVPAQLIYKINQKSITNPAQLQPGTELKVILGPFNAEIDTTEKTLTLIAKRMYAGSFKIRTTQIPSSGIASIESKSNEGAFGPQILLQGGTKIASTAEPSESSIGLSDREVSDLYSILSESSHIKIR